MADVRLEALRKEYPGPPGQNVALAGLDLTIADGEFLVLVGPSGCGKSTTLRLVAGLERPTAGRVYLGGRDVTELPPQQRDLAMVFQSYALYPHKTVHDNLAFPLRMRRTPRAEIDARVRAVAARLGLEPLLRRRPAQLSGGQRQRVALGRALVRSPAAFLLDEPLSNLDAGLRLEMRAELARLHRELGATMLQVTHDQEEAMTLGDRVAVMREGRLEQCAPPMQLYHAPASVFVASFLGSPPINLLPARVVEGRVRVAPGLAAGEVTVGVRPHDLMLVAPDHGDLEAVVDVVAPLGSTTVVHVDAGGHRLVAVIGDGETPRERDRVGVRFRPDRLHLFDTDSGRRLDALQGSAGADFEE